MIPFEIKEVSEKEEAMIKEVFTGHERKWIKLGPQNYTMPGVYRDFAEKVYNLDVRDDDVWVVSYPRCGTTVTQEMCWLLCNQLNFKAATATVLHERFPFIEIEAAIPDKLKPRIGITGILKFIEEMPSPRFIKTHMPFSLLPPALFTKNIKIIYVARNPKDVVTSYYHHQVLFGQEFFNKDFNKFWKLFWNDLLMWSPIIDHALEAWKMRHHPNLLFLFYEDIRRDMFEVLKKVSKFLNQTYDEGQLQSLADHLDFDNMKKNTSVNMLDAETKKILSLKVADENLFIRKGEVGSWRHKLDESMIKEADDYIHKKLVGTDFKYPE